MKKILLLLFCMFTLVACNNTPKAIKWEYKVVSVDGTTMDNDKVSAFEPTTFEDQTAMLNNMGQQGWELVSTYTETNTVFPNFGDDKYVTGLQANTRTARVSFVFKRPYVEKKK